MDNKEIFLIIALTTCSVLLVYTNSASAQSQHVLNMSPGDRYQSGFQHGIMDKQNRMTQAECTGHTIDYCNGYTAGYNSGSGGGDTG